MLSKNKVFHIILSSLGLLTLPMQIQANDIKTSGFGSIGFSFTDSETPYLREMLTEDPSYIADAIIGLQFSGELQSGVEYFAQLIAKDSNGHFDANADWLLVSFPINETLKIRGGRLRLPLFFLSKQIEVGNTYPWIRPPAEIYEMIEYTGYTGFDLLYSFVWNTINIQIQPFVGQTTEEIVVDLLPGGPAEITTDENFGLALQISEGLTKFRFAYFKADATVNPNASFSDVLNILAVPTTAFTSDRKAEYVAAGLQFENDKWIIIAEAAKRKITPSSLPDMSSYYIVFARYFTDSILIHTTFAVRNADGRDTLGVGFQEQETTTLGIK